MGRPSRPAALAVALSAVLVAGCGQTSADRSPVADLSMHDEDGMNGAVLTKPYDVPDLTLTDTRDQPYSLATDTRNAVTLVFFGYTHCPDICQVVMADIASAMTRLDPADRRQVGMLFVTSDPSRDDPATLRTYLDRFDPRFEGLTGDLRVIRKAADALGVPIEKGDRLPSGGYAVAHGTQIVGMGADGRAPIVWTEGTSAAQLAQDLSRMVAHGGVPSPGAAS